MKFYSDSKLVSSKSQVSPGAFHGLTAINAMATLRPDAKLTVKDDGLIGHIMPNLVGPITVQSVSGPPIQKVTEDMSQFEPPISFTGQGLASLVIAIIAFVAVVAFFLYENLQKRSITIELLLAVVAAFTLGTAIFFALIRADVIL